MVHAWKEQPAPNRYFDPTFGAEAAKILPGEFYVTGRDMLLVTVLGSCVAACIRDRGAGVGGMNHFMLPEGGDDAKGSESARYGAYAMEVLVNELLKRGARRERLEAKVFGGGAVIRGMETINIGEKNSKFVLDYLHTERISLAAQDLQLDCARKVYYFPHSGKVRVKRFRNFHNDTILAREREYQRKISVTTKVAGEVELF